MALKIKEKNRENVHMEEAIKNIVKGEVNSKMNVLMPKQLLSKFKIKAIQNNTSMSDLVVKWIKDYVKE